MTSQRLQRIEELFHSARERAPAERGAFLDAACDGDAVLRQDVESLLAQRDGTLLRQGVADAAARVLPSSHGSREGQTLGPYLLGPLIGAGGMGEVYRARDTKLGRDVAVKILPPTLAQHPERLARLEREARILAALNHPNIAAIHGIEDSDGVRALVLELVDGATLAEKLQDRPRGRPALPLDEALPIARQMAEVLAAAHDKGIVHRDLKPANVKLTPGGMVKVLDFGIAKIRTPDDVEPAALSVLETTEGAVLGTVAYMSPEQARGLAVDKRTDIWAFGCVLFEMIAGRRSFPGESSADVLGAITSADPDWTLLPADTPLRVRDVLRRCLTKDPARRLHDIADARIEIEDAIADPAAIGHADRRDATTSRLSPVIPWILTAVFAAVAMAAVRSALTATPPEPKISPRLSVPLPPQVSLFAPGGSSMAISPDGRRLVYVGLAGGRRQLYARLLDGVDSAPIAGTESAANPFFSADGRWIGFMTTPEAGSLKRVPVEGGKAITVVDNMGDGQRGIAVQGGTWAPQDTIIFAAINPRSRGLWRVPAIGGSPERVTTPSPGEGHHWPQILPNGKAVIYTVSRNNRYSIAMQPLAGGEPSTLVEDASYGSVVSPDGRRAWLVYAGPAGLLAAPFDLDGLRAAGRAVPILEGVLPNRLGGAQVAVSARGTLAYVPGAVDEINRTLAWVGRDGAATEITTVSGLGYAFSLSPDGRRIVRPSFTPGVNRDLWIDDLVERKSIRLTDGVVASAPIWTADGLRVIYSVNGNLHWRAADRSDQQEPLTTGPNAKQAGSVSPNGSTLAYHDVGSTGTDIWLLPLKGPRQPTVFLNTPFAELDPRFSPDGRWIAYRSNLSGDNFEVWIKPLAGGAEFQVSRGGGQGPLWSPDGRELYYRNADPLQGGDMMAVPIDTTGREPRIGVPRLLFPSPYQGVGDIARDGRFLLLKRAPLESPSRVIHLVLNWFDDLQARVPLP